MSSPSEGVVHFRTPCAFYAELKERVSQYFETTGRNPTGGVRFWLKASFILAWVACSYLWLILASTYWWDALIAATSLSFGLAAIGFCIQHDGNHKSVSRNRWANDIASGFLDVIGGNAFVWRFKHNILHHTYPNIDDLDDDIDAKPFLRMAPTQPKKWFHRFQGVYVWPLYCVLPSKWHFFDDFRALVTGKVGARKLPKRNAKRIAGVLLGKLMFFAWALVLPLVLCPVWKVLLLYVWIAGVLGILIGATFQLAHCLEGREFFSAKETECARTWAEHQIATTADFCQRNPLVTWFMGGLNFQIEHHLFPTVSHLHYPKIAPIVKEVCQKHSIPYKQYPSLLSALRAHAGYMWRLGKAERV